MEYRRAKIEGGTFFFTVVTHNRREFLCNTENIQLLRQAFREVMSKSPFIVDAIVILPNHIHCIWTLALGDSDFSDRWRLIKNLPIIVIFNIKEKSLYQVERKVKKLFATQILGTSN